MRIKDKINGNESALEGEEGERVNEATRKFEAYGIIGTRLANYVVDFLEFVCMHRYQNLDDAWEVYKRINNIRQHHYL
jgi:hypothetical protein